jgi:hypothetical protein
VKLDRNSAIGGLPVKVVRDMLRRLGYEGFIRIETVVEHLQQHWWHEFVEDLFKRGVIDRDQRNGARKYFDPKHLKQKLWGVRVPKMPDFRAPARTLFDHLLAEGYIDLDHDPWPKESIRHKLTIKGEALRMTRFVPRIDRSKAKMLLKDVLGRVDAINADPEMLHWVTEVRVFGSYLTDTNDLGDLDLALNYKGRWLGEGWKPDWEAFAKKQGKDHIDWLHKLSLPERMVKERIKGRSPYISIHYASELDNSPEMGGKTIYTFTPPSKGNRGQKWKRASKPPKRKAP